jgi:predicted DNA-binding transcriptional regulator YafY
MGMPDTTLRQIAMLSLIPGRPGKITARELHSKLKAQGHDVHVRSIERDLPKLSCEFPLINDQGRPAGWSWEAKDMRLTFPRMNEGTALTYELLSRYLAPILPRDMRKHLESDFAQARSVLNQLRASPLGRWSKCIAVLPFGQQLLPPDVKQDVSDVVYDALLNGKRFEANYRALNSEKTVRYPFNPLGLVYVQGVLYLIATLWEYGDARQFALHRMSNAKPLDEVALAIKGFDFGRYVREEKSFDHPLGDTIRIELIVQAWLARHLEERRLSEDQVITPIHDGANFRVAATVMDTRQLFLWLSSLGANVEVVKPAVLRRKMVAQVKALTQQYR